MAGIAEPRPAVFLSESEQTVRSTWAASEWPGSPDHADLDAAIDQLVDGD